MTKTLSAGDNAPDFVVETADGSVSLADLKGKYLILYFYPRDNTPGCTREAIAFSALKEDFAREGAHILGISRDSLKKHENFTAKHSLSIPLGADTDGAVCEAYGVWVKKKLYGREYMGIQRATFLIESNGRIAHIWPKVKLAGHAEDVLETLRALKSE